MGHVDNEPPHQIPSPGPAVTAAAVERHSLSTDSVWDRIKRHKVVEWTLAYVAFAYAVLHGVQMLRETFEWPLLVPRLTVFILLVGVPVAATLAWYHGHRAQHRISGVELSILIALLLIAGSVLWFVSRHESTAASAVHDAPSSAARETVFNPPPHSIAVLPFVNISGDKEQEYFSDGLTEELLNSLARINELQVAARTSSFSFKGQNVDLSTIARKLNVGAILEGSVRRSGHTIRVTAQLNNAVSGFHLWSQTYDRDLGDVLKLQTEIATAVASALKVALLADVGEKIELGGTRNPKAFDAYLRGRRINWQNEHDLQEQIASYSEAIKLDPQYALAYAARSSAYRANAQFFTPGPVLSSDSAAKYAQALADARQSVALAPDLPEGYTALAAYFMATLHSAEAKEAVDHAVTLAPSDARALREAGYFYANIGQVKTGLAMTEKGLARDPVSPDAYFAHGWALYGARRYAEALPVLERAVELDGKGSTLTGNLGIVKYVVGDYSGAATSCEVRPDYWLNQVCLAIAYHKLGRHADAAVVRAKYQAASPGDAYEYAQIDAQWGNQSKALDWLDTAMRVRDAGLLAIKTDPLVDPLRNESRFQAIERALKFPD
jgi:TolB-like protein/Flp pilus assembly protein TadD